MYTCGIGQLTYRVLNLILPVTNLILSWLMGAAIVRSPNTNYTQSIGAHWEKLL